MASSLSNVINYCRIINGSKGFNDTKTQFTNEITQDYNTAREDTVYRFDVLINSIDAKDVYINDSTTSIKGVVDISRKQTADTEMEEKLQVYPNLIKCGDYIKFKVNETDELRTYLIKSKIDKKHGYDEGIFEECNYVLKWMYKGVLYKMPVIVSNQTKYTLGVSTQVAGISEGSSRYQILMSFNSISKVIDEGQRFIFNNNAWKTTQVDFISDKGLLSILLGQDSINTEIDNTDLEVAGYYANKHTYTYNIPTSFEVSKDNTYQLLYSIKDETGKDFDYSLVTATTTNNTLVNITNNNGVITVKGMGIGTGSIKLSVPIGETSKDFDINFEVKAIVPDKITYDPDFSQGTTIKQYVTSILKVDRYINGVKDLTVPKISYSFDTLGQTLIANKKIIVSQTGDNLLSIKNALINTTTVVHLSVTDSISGEKILDNAPITFVKGI